MRGLSGTSGRGGAGTRRRRERARAVAVRLAMVAAGALAPLVALEIGLRALPVAAGNVKRAITAADPVPRYASETEVVWSLGWDFSRVVHKRTNRAGFFSEVEYAPSRDVPVLAVIGDSYVEALQVANAAALDGVLRRRPEARAEIYAFGVSGAPLSQYLGFAELARRAYGAAAMVFVVVGNDFDESHEDYRTSAGGTVFAVDPRTGRLELATRGREASALRRLARRSALLRYLTFNVRPDWEGLARGLRRAFGAAAPGPATAEPRFVGNTAAAADPARLAASLAVLDRFFELLPEKAGLPPERIAFLLDGLRPQLYEPDALRAAEESYFGRMRRELAARARSRGYEVIDLQPRFVARWRAERRRFDVPGDGHWNERGHALAAEAVAGSALWRRCCAAPGATAGEPARPRGRPAPLRVADGRVG